MCFVSVYLVNCLFLCASLCGHLAIWGLACVGQMPFPPEYLAPPAERVKKEKKTKTPKNKRETTGKVRKERGEQDG